MSRALIEAFDLERHRSVQLVGGGGKTSLMLAMAEALRAEGRPVIVGTSARIRVPQGWPAPVLGGTIEALLGPATAALRREGRACVAAAVEPGTDKLCGLDPALIDALARALPEAWLLIEADGSAGRPIKAHAAHEPALSPGVGLVVAVLGMGALGAPLLPERVHRAELLAERLGRPLGSRLEQDDLVQALLAPWGTFARAAPGAARAVFLASAAPPPDTAAERLAAALLSAGTVPPLGRVAWGELCVDPAWIAWRQGPGQSSMETSHS